MFAEELSNALPSTQHPFAPPGSLKYVILPAVAEEQVPTRAKTMYELVPGIPNVRRGKEVFNHVHNDNQVEVCRGGRSEEIPLLEFHLSSSTAPPCAA
jgi:hypothetical protein